MNIVEVNSDNVYEKGFFCYMSKSKSLGYQRKLKWLRGRFDEGLKIKMLDLAQGGRGFIEYIPGEYAWRAVDAEGYMFIHCLWVVGRSKGKGYATLLLNECLRDAEKTGLKGVVVLTSERNWLVGKKLFLKYDFKSIERYPPFELLAYKFGDEPSPAFSGDFEERVREFVEGLTVIRSAQCPYVEAATKAALDAAEELGIGTKVIELNCSDDVRRLSPSPYGVFSIVYKGRLVSYHSVAKKGLMSRLGNLTRL